MFIRRRAPYRRFRDFLPAETAEQVLIQILDRELEFCPLKGDRNFLRLPGPLDPLPGFSERLSTMLPQIQSLFGIDLREPEVELYVHAYNDGTYFGRHADTRGGGNWRRRISCVYYVHRRPCAFDGGDLVVYDRRGSAHAISAEHNSAVFFPADLLHEVRRVTCRSRDFADSRFSINVWIM
jgi:Rps23 Pro-64 3,4-dihydroxylase Tpa1-like proline 4-hydroxylase